MRRAISTEVEEGERNGGGGDGAGGSEPMLAMLVEVVLQGALLRNLAASSSPMRGFLQVQTQGSWCYGKLVPGSLVTLDKLLTLSEAQWSHL